MKQSLRSPERPLLNFTAPLTLLALCGLGGVLASPALAVADPLVAEYATSLCSQDSVLHASPRLCNEGTLPARFELQFEGLPAGTYPNGICNIAGPTVFSLSGAQPVLVPAGTCVDLDLSVNRPAGMTEQEKACFQIRAQNLDSDLTTESHTVIYDGGNLCAEANDGSATGVPVGQQVPMSFTVYNQSTEVVTFEYQFESVSSAGDPPVVSLNGGPAGAAATGTVLIPPRAESEISVGVSMTEAQPGVRHDLLLRDRGTGALLASRGFSSFVAGCDADGETLCLNGGRFEVKAVWRDFAGQTGVGHTGGLTGDTGYFWFFSPNNIEVVLKVLDGRYLNEKWWVFFGALSDVEYVLTVRDTTTGESRSYYNPSGVLASVGDTSALPGYDPIPTSLLGLAPALGGPSPFASRAAASKLDAEPAPVGNCVASATVFCVQGGRFQVEVDWNTATGSGQGQAEILTTETGYFWFFSSNNIELVVKVLDGRGINGHWWVFFGALSDVDYTLRVTDTVTGSVKTYHNTQGTLASVADIEAFED